jgi:hypothetical protein
MNDTVNIWDILSTIASLSAVIVAIILSVVPVLIHRHKEKTIARSKIKNVFILIDHYLNEHRFYNTETIIINHNIYIKNHPEKLDYKIDLIGLLDSVREDLIIAKFRKSKELALIFYKTYEILSGTPQSIISWYKLESDIVLFFELDNQQKKFWLHEENCKFIGDTEYKCAYCNDPYSENEILSYDDMNEEQKYISKALDVCFCKKHKIPMHLQSVK